MNKLIYGMQILDNIKFIVFVLAANFLIKIGSNQLEISEYKNVTLDLCGLNQLSDKRCCKKCIKWHTTIRQTVYPQKERMTRVMDGRYADDAEFPYSVLIKKELSKGPEMTCSGVILNQRWIITAAHCIMNAIKIKVYAGHTDYPIDKNSYYTESLTKMYEKYNHSLPPIDLYEYDIGLIKLRESLPINEKINGICLPNYKFRHYGQELALYCGWGKTNNKFIDNNKRLKVATVKLMADDWRFLTATDINTGVGCFGDSGSPLIQYVNGRAVLIGIFNGALRANINKPYFGSCAKGEAVMTFARVADYVNWISNTIQEYKNF